jgi:hypothetical protein
LWQTNPRLRGQRGLRLNGLEVASIPFAPFACQSRSRVSRVSRLKSLVLCGEIPSDPCPSCPIRGKKILPSCVHSVSSCSHFLCVLCILAANPRLRGRRGLRLKSLVLCASACRTGLSRNIKLSSEGGSRFRAKAGTFWRPNIPSRSVPKSSPTTPPLHFP